MKKQISVRRLAIVGLLASISVVLGMTPLGFIPVGPIFATTMHLPVIIGAMIEGPVVGGLVGLLFGLNSVFRAVTQPTPTSFINMNPLVSVVPRVAMGIIVGVLYRWLKTKDQSFMKKSIIAFWVLCGVYMGYNIYKGVDGGTGFYSYIIILMMIIVSMVLSVRGKNAMQPSMAFSAVVGTGVNTIGYLGMTYLIFAQPYMEAIGQSPDLAGNVIMTIALTNGVPEIVIAALVVPTIVIAVTRRNRK